MDDENAGRGLDGAEAKPTGSRTSAGNNALRLLGGSGLLMAFGLACFNYTKPSGLGHHTAVAAEQGLPPPSDLILFLGMISAVLGGIVGWAAIARLRSSFERR